MISAIIASIWNVFIKFRWHAGKLTDVATTVEVLPPNIYSGVLFDWQSTRMLKGNQMVLTLESSHVQKAKW